MKTVATILQITRGLLILTPAEYDKPEGGFAVKNKGSNVPTVFNVPQIFELNDSLKEHPFEKAEELAAFVNRCAESVSLTLGDLFICIEDEDVLITKEYKHAPAKEKLLPTFARVEAENVLHQEVEKYTILNFEYGQQYGKASKSDEISASLFAMNTGMLTDIRAAFENAGLRLVKIVPPIAGMLYTCKADVNSSTKAIAVISMDFAATRLVVLHNGAPVFQQSFSSVLEDIAELFSLEFGMSKMGAIDFIRQEGLGVCAKCESPSTQKQTMGMLDNAAGEILRNLRMVISTKRLDIDQIVLVDALAKLPNIANYCRKMGLTAEMENITRLFTGSAQPPQAAPSASEKGFDTTSFITLNGVLTMPPAEGNLLMGENNILSAMAKDSGSKLGKMITAGVGVAAGIWIVAVLGWWGALAMRENSDNSQLVDPRYTPAKQLITDEEFWTKQQENMEKNLEMLPNTDLKSADIVTEFYAQIVDKAKSCTEFNADNSKNIISTVVDVDNIEEFTKFKNEVNAEGYFKVGDGYQLNTVVDNKKGGTNPIQLLRATINLSVTDETIAAASEAAGKDTQKTTDDKSGSKTKESSESSSASSDASKAG